MKRILFVDDEIMVLRGLERTLYPMAGEWDMVFLNTGNMALAQMAQTPFDVVVADMRMPGMNGAELLSEVMRRYPRTVRLILSGHADNDLVMKCVGSTHQYLRKPCDAAMLQATIKRATTLEATLQSKTLRELASRMERLPTLPSLYVDIMKALESPEAPLEKIAAIVARDIGMTAKLLQLANSAFFGLHRQVSDPLEAVSYLGVDTLKSLVLSIEVFTQFTNAKAAGFSVENLWFHSAQTAAAAKAIARAERADPKLVNEAFSAGLLHDCGKLVLAANFSAQYAEALQLAADRCLTSWEAEQQVFGANHADVGAYLLGLWGLPVPIVEAIALHHGPAQSPDRTFCPLTAVHAGNVLANECVRVRPSGLPLVQVDSQYLETCGLVDRLPAWRVCVSQAWNEKVAT